MEMIDAVVAFLSLPAVRLGACALASLVLYAIFRKRDEFSRNAIRNTAATLVVAAANMAAGIFFVKDINAFLQHAYAALHVPTINPHVWDNVPLWLGTIIALVAKDFVDYWSHRLMHTPWFWPTHAAHHSDTHVNGFTTFRVHFLEGTVMLASYILLLTWLQLPHLVPIVFVISSLLNMYVHLNLDFTHGPLRYLIASPVYHRWHHADVPEAYGKNLANIIPLFDVMFGTYYVPGVCKEQMGALSSGMEDTNPVAIILYPVKQWARLIGKACKPFMPSLRRVPVGRTAR